MAEKSKKEFTFETPVSRSRKIANVRPVNPRWRKVMIISNFSTQREILATPWRLGKALEDHNFLEGRFGARMGPTMLFKSIGVGLARFGADWRRFWGEFWRFFYHFWSFLAIFGPFLTLGQNLSKMGVFLRKFSQIFLKKFYSFFF